MQQRLKAVSGAAWAGIVASQFLGKLFVAMDGAKSAFDVCF
jgi:hypothetical protein